MAISPIWDVFNFSQPRRPERLPIDCEAGVFVEEVDLFLVQMQHTLSAPNALPVFPREGKWWLIWDTVKNTFAA